MENDVKKLLVRTRKITQDIIMLVWFKQGIMVENPSTELTFMPETSREFLEDMCNSVWIESYKNELEWNDFFKNHFKRMTTTPYLFANYVAYACYLLHQTSCNMYESSFYTLALINHFVLLCWQEERKEFVNTCVDLFCAFFEKEIGPKFMAQEVRLNFNHYLQKQEFFTAYKELVRVNRSIHDIFKEFQDRHLESTELQDIDGIVLKDITENQVETHQEAVAFADSIADKMKELCRKTFEEVLRDFAKTDRQAEELYRQEAGEASGGMPTEARVSSEDVEEEPLQDIQNKTSSKKNDKKKKAKPSDTSEDTNLDMDISKSKDLRPTAPESNRVPKLTKAVEQYRQEVGETSGGMPSEPLVSSEDVKKEAPENLQSKTTSMKNDKNKKVKAPDGLNTEDSDLLKPPALGPAAPESDLIPKLTKVERVQKLLKEMLEDVTKISELIKFLYDENESDK